MKRKAKQKGSVEEWYHKINAIIAIVPWWICLDYNKRNMNSISLVLNLVRETFFPVDHKPNPFWFSQIQQQNPNKRHHHHKSHSPSLHIFKKSQTHMENNKNHTKKSQIFRICDEEKERRNKRVCILPQNLENEGMNKELLAANGGKRESES